MFAKSSFKRSLAVLTVASLTLAGCAGSGAKSNFDQSSMNQRERSLYDYAGQHYVEAYAAQAGIAGAVAGALIGCIAARALGASCGEGAAVGGLLGAGAGAAIGAEEGRKTEELAKRQLSAQQANQIADTELAAARGANADAAVLVQQQRAALADLRAKVSSRSANADQAKKALDAAKQTEALIGGSSEHLKQSIKDLDQQITIARAKGASTADLVRRKKSLEDEEKKLDQALADLSADRKSTERSAGA